MFIISDHEYDLHSDDHEYKNYFEFDIDGSIVNEITTDLTFEEANFLREIEVTLTDDGYNDEVYFSLTFCTWGGDDYNGAVDTIVCHGVSIHEGINLVTLFKGVCPFYISYVNISGYARNTDYQGEIGISTEDGLKIIIEFWDNY